MHNFSIIYTFVNTIWQLVNVHTCSDKNACFYVICIIYYLISAYSPTLLSQAKSCTYAVHISGRHICSQYLDQDRPSSHPHCGHHSCTVVLYIYICQMETIYIGKIHPKAEQLTIFRNYLSLSTFDSDHVDRVSNSLENQCFYIIHHHPTTIPT